MLMPLKFVSLLLIFCPFYSQLSVAQSLEDEHLSASPVIELDSAIQQQMEIKTQILQAVLAPVYQTTYGKVLDLTALLSLRRDCLEGHVQQQQARKQFGLSQQALKRLETMFRHKAVSQRKLEQQRRQWLADQARLEQLQISNTILLAKSRQRWGKLADRFCQPELTDKFLSGAEKILAIVKPDEPIVPTINLLQLDVNATEQAIVVQALDSTNLFDPVKQVTYLLYTTTAAQLFPGQHFSVSLPLAINPRHGLIVPGQSVLWHLGQAFVYIKIDAEHFQHRNIEELVPVRNGYWVSGGLNPGDELVVNGAQQLLSTEFRSQIVDEDDD
jgi:hypothetical protein